MNPRVKTRGWVGYGYDPGQKFGEWVHGYTHDPPTLSRVMGLMGGYFLERGSIVPLL